MRKPTRQKPRHKANPQSQPQKVSSETKAPIKTGWMIASKIGGSIIAIIGVGAAIATFWPRITVDESGTFANQASIVFGAINKGLLPLRNPSVGMNICDLSYGPQHLQFHRIRANQPHVLLRVETEGRTIGGIRTKNIRRDLKILLLLVALQSRWQIL
jgi:hypothetical protein